MTAINIIKQKNAVHMLTDGASWIFNGGFGPACCRAKAGTVVTFIPRLQGGNNVLRAVLAVVVAIAATLVAGPLAGQITIAGMALTTSTAAFATAGIAGGIVPAGPVALDALWRRGADCGSVPLSKTCCCMIGYWNAN